MAILLGTILPGALFAQDTIVFRNGNEVVVKVTEVSDTQIKYNLWSNQGGAVFTKNISDIFMVKYKGGHKDVYDKQPTTQSAAISTTPNVTVKNGRNYISLDGKMERSRGDMEINDNEIEEELLKKLLTADEFQTFESAHRQRGIGNGLLIPGIILSGGGFLCWFSCAILLADGYWYSEYVGFSVGMSVFALGLTFLAAAIPLKSIARHRLDWVADSYNQRTFGKGVSLSIAPRMFSNPNKTGSRGSAFGAGITLNF